MLFLSARKCIESRSEIHYREYDICSRSLAPPKPSSVLAPPRVATPPECSKSSSVLATPRVALLRERINPTSSAPKPSSTLATPRVALLRERISPTSSAPKPSSALATPRVALLHERISPTSVRVDAQLANLWRVGFH
ncbi:hypothetical protein F511_07279 [Dorcoceras hygrometricum]|uniref:Uncharacterized protein n=1 Tax=Dorcoceras hygrometricum TaxID=472368 RepID=A0A2Z7AU65_9LAMI|nr:hypothetical protein F511_07279 [Dorcoceras hygrometricum]